MAIKEFHPTIQELKKARKRFEENEPRDLFYRAAIELLKLSQKKESSLSKTEALAVLLQTWNKMYYRFHPFDSKHFNKIDRLLKKHKKALASVRKRSIFSFSDKDTPLVGQLFADFSRVLGSVGAAKALHLLAPKFFPLWDQGIAKAYGLYLDNKSTEKYIDWIVYTKKQCQALGDISEIYDNPLKALDEYNYCKFTKRWL